MTASELMAHLEVLADRNDIEDRPVMLDGELLINATIVDGCVVLQTRSGYFNAIKPCKDHNPRQHRDGKVPWCNECGLTENWYPPIGYSKLEDRTS